MTGTLSPDETAGTPRLVFANQLRGLAALAVAGSHLVGVFWGMQDFLALATAAPAQGGPVPGIFSLFAYPWLNFGPLGVGVFFLISGLVIPISLQHHTRGSFLLARALRIYPVYAFAALACIAVIGAEAAYWHRPFPYGGWTVGSNVLLIYNLVGQPSIDLVNWTLCVELKFYLLMALLAPAIRRGSVLPLFILAAGLLGLDAALSAGPLAGLAARVPNVAGAVGTEAVFLVYMLIGVLFHCHLQRRVGTARLLCGVAALFACFVGCWRLSPIAAQVPVVTLNYGYALGIFGLAYALRRHARSVRLLDWMAAISFPFYLVHSTIGYAVMKYAMIAWGVPYLAALGLAMLVVVAVAHTLHVSVERWTIQAGKRIAGRATIPIISRPRLKDREYTTSL